MSSTLAIELRGCVRGGCLWFWSHHGLTTWKRCICKVLYRWKHINDFPATKFEGKAPTKRSSNGNAGDGVCQAWRTEGDSLGSASPVSLAYDMSRRGCSLVRLENSSLDMTAKPESSMTALYAIQEETHSRERMISIRR